MEEFYCALKTLNRQCKKFPTEEDFYKLFRRAYQAPPPWSDVTLLIPFVFVLFIIISALSYFIVYTTNTTNSLVIENQKTAADKSFVVYSESGTTTEPTPIPFTADGTIYAIHPHAVNSSLTVHNTNSQSKFNFAVPLGTPIDYTPDFSSKNPSTLTGIG